MHTQTAIDFADVQANILRGVNIRRGDAVTAVIGSANGDDKRWKHPDRFDIHRENAALNVLLKELPVVKPAGMPRWQADPYLRSVANLPVGTA
jgi:cytochrome P450